MTSQTVLSWFGAPALIVAIEAMPSELVRQFTLLREVDAKYSGISMYDTKADFADLQSKISTEIDTFITSASKTPPQQRGQQLFSITRLMTSALGCADEKVSVASSAADISDKHKLRLDADYDRLETSEISELIQFGPSDHPAYLAGMTMGMSRSASRRLAIAEAKKRDEDLQDWRKEQIGRRGQLVAEERTKTGAGAKKKAAALSAVGGRENGVGTPPRGVTPVGVVGEVVKKSHHKKKPPRTDEEPAASHKRKHPNQYTHLHRPSSADRRYVPTPNRQNTPREQMREVEDEGIGDTSNDGVPGDEHTYCYCNGVSYGEMVACDRENCAREWCVNSWNLTNRVVGFTSNVQNWQRRRKGNGIVKIARRSWSGKSEGDIIRKLEPMVGRRRGKIFSSYCLFGFLYLVANRISSQRLIELIYMEF
jgi:hypothetical protein